MTESEWLACQKPMELLGFSRRRPESTDRAAHESPNSPWIRSAVGDDRKYFHFMCACCRYAWDRLPEQCNRDAVVAVEAFLEGDLSMEALQAAIEASSTVESRAGQHRGYWIVKNMGRAFYKMSPWQAAGIVAVLTLKSFGTFVPDEDSQDGANLANLLRCMFGNPFQPIGHWSQLPAWLAWRNGAIPQLAQAIYDTRDFSGMPILGDALEEAGCADTEMLAHLRGPGPHARGCWVLDVVLGKP